MPELNVHFPFDVFPSHNSKDKSVVRDFADSTPSISKLIR